MLLSLNIVNFAIIDRLEIRFTSGLNVLTGETGAGKSIIVGALTAILGGRGGVEWVRSGEERAIVDAVFDISDNAPLIHFLGECGYELDEENLFLSREISINGKSSARIGGRPAPISILRQVGEYLVDLHGQHEHQSLLSVNRHLYLLDEWGGDEVLSLRKSVESAYRQLLAKRVELSRLEENAKDRASKMDLFHFQLEEIENAALIPGEEEKLERDILRLNNTQKLSELSANVYKLLMDETDKSIIDSLNAAVKDMETIASLDSNMSEKLEALRSSLYELEELARDILRYNDSIENNPVRLEQLVERNETIRALKRKYGGSIEEILAYAVKIANDLDALTHHDEKMDALQREIAKDEKSLFDMCEKLTAMRMSLAEEFEGMVMAELADLAMDKTKFKVVIQPSTLSSEGMDSVEFMISPNTGEALRPLAKIASGGELSRVMLAIKSSMAKKQPLPTMVFDEIDAGVGGKTAYMIGKKMHSLSESSQIICITHLAQIASQANMHFYIHKLERDGRTSVSIDRVHGEERVQEVARMLAGAHISDTVMQHAREMLQGFTGQ
jgi:DNA repair protein RecN (Recombination protein N)